MRRLFLILLFAGIFLLGLAMRSPEILAKNYLFGFDQGRDFLQAYNIAHDHKLTLIGAEVGAGSAGIQGVFHGPGYFYLLAIMELLFHYDPYGGLVLMYLFGVGALLMVFFTTRKIFNDSVALISLFLLSIAPLIAPQSRFVWNHHPSSFFIAIYFYFLYKIQHRPVLYGFLAVLTAGVIYNFELAIAVPLVLLTFVVVPFIYRIWNKKVWAAMLIAAVLAFSPMIFFEAKHGFTATRGVIAHVFHKNVTTQYDEKGNVKKDEGFFLAQKQYAFIANARDSFVFESGKIPPSLYVSTIILVLFLIFLSIFQTRNRFHKRYLLALLTAIPVTFLVFLPLRNSVWPYYLIHLHFVYLYCFSYAVVYFLSRATKHPFHALASFFIIFFFISMSFGLAQRVRLNWNVDYSDFGGKEKILGKRQIIDAMAADAKQNNLTDYSVFVFTPPVYTYAYDYLLQTYAKQKYGYNFKREKKGTAYMIMEVDWGKPWSYKGWLETVIKDGKVDWDHNILPDLILEKREFL